MVKKLLVILFLSIFTSYSQIDKFFFGDGVEYFTYVGDIITESKFITNYSEVSDSIIVYLFNNFKYLGDNTWKTNGTITKYFKENNKYIFLIRKDE